jgi:hypothetical protein
MKKEISQPIASRTLSFGSQELTVVLGLPQPIEGHDFQCSYVILVGEDVRGGHAIGVDGVQALQLAMRKIGSDLIHMSRVSGVPVSWMDGEPGVTGFEAEAG